MFRVTVLEEEKSGLGAEMNAYKATIEDLEQRVLAAKMEHKIQGQSIEAIGEGGVDLGGLEIDSGGSTFGAGATENNGLSLDTLKEESVQLKALLEHEITNLEESLNSREEEARSATILAAEYAEKYSKLKEEFDAQIQRLVLKLSLEQQARADVEERIDSVSVSTCYFIVLWPL